MNEQRRIVAKIEELFSELDAGVAALQRAKANLKRYRAAVLKAAVEGKLTEAWRAKQVESASRRFSQEESQTWQDAASTLSVEAASRRFSQDDPKPGHETAPETSKYSQSTFLSRPGATDFEIAFFDPELPVAIADGNLPHWRQEGRTYFVTFRTADSLPQEKLRIWQAERDEWFRKNPEPLSVEQKKEYWRKFPERIQEWLDSGFGECQLAQPEIRKIVAIAMRHFDGARYRLHSWVVMPNHVHALLTPFGTNELAAILHSWKSFTAKEINKLTGRSGSFWQKESFDHIVRSPEAFERIEAYIRSNPAHLRPGTFTLWPHSETRQDAASTLIVEAASRRFSQDTESSPQGIRSRSNVDSACDPFSDSNSETRQDAASTLIVEAASRRYSQEESQTRQDAASTVEPASKLLERILTERRQKWEADQLAKFAATGKTPPQNWKSKYVEPSPPDTTDLPELPESWCWANVGQLLYGIEGGKSFECLTRPAEMNEWGVIKVSAMTWGTFLQNEQKAIPLGVKFDPANEIKTNDLLLSRSNTTQLVGASVLVGICRPRLLLSDKSLRLLVNEMLNRIWLHTVLSSSIARSQLSAMATGTSDSMRNVSQDKINSVVLPLPPPSEQLQIVSEVSERLSQINAAETVIENSLRRATRLRQSILKRAFEGKLVPQDPNDEPASALLERIRAGRDRMDNELRERNGRNGARAGKRGR